MAAVTYYPVHPYCADWPAFGDGDEAAVSEESVREVGVVQPVWIWTDSYEKVWLIDGQRRQTIVKKLRDAGVTKADNGDDIDLPAIMFEGTAADVLKRIKNLNMKRRHATTSQRAAQAVLYRKRITELHAANGEESPDFGSDWGGFLAREYNTNRQYVFDCQSMLDHAPDIFADLVIGKVNMPEARQAMNRMKVGQVPYPEPNGTGTQANTPQATTGGSGSKALSTPAPVSDGDTTVRDRLGNVVSNPQVALAFQELPAFTEARKHLNAGSKAIKNLCDGPGGAFLMRKELLHEAANLSAALGDAAPYMVCNHCDGEQTIDGDACNQCKGAGYLNRVQAKMLEKAAAS